jgi:hypothetical protein
MKILAKNEKETFTAEVINYDFSQKIVKLLLENTTKLSKQIYLDNVLYNLTDYRIKNDGKIIALYNEDVLETINYLKKSHINHCDFKNNIDKYEYIIKLFQ